MTSAPPTEPTNPPADQPLPRLRICASRGWVPVNLRELWEYRELLWFFAVRDVKVRYKQALLGVAWAVLQPLFTMLVFTILFSLLMGSDNRPSPDGIPYAVSTFCALVPWQLFSTSLAQSSNSLIAESRVITKVYFPRLIAPLAPTLAALVDCGISFAILILMMLFYGIVPGWAILTLPLFVVFAIVASLSISLWLASLNAIYRDVRYTVPFIIQSLMYISPVVYSVDSLDLSPTLKILYGLNPMAGVIEGFRWALLGTSEPPGLLLMASAVAVIVLLTGAVFYFRRMERRFADLI